VRILTIIVVLTIALTACGVAPNTNETQSPTDFQALNPTPQLDLTSTLVPEPSQEAGTPPFTGYTSGALWLHLFSPNDGDIVSQPEINVTGQAPAETVISLNETILLVSGNGLFSIPVLLEEGPNVIEMVASNLDGDEIYLVMTIVYEK
jgi:hypothetical protein